MIDLNPFGSSEPRGFATLGDGRLVFVATTGNRGPNFELAVTDGTRAGTKFVADFGPNSSTPFDFTLLPDGRLLFSANGNSGSAASDRELYVTDGSAAGSGRVLDISPGAASSSPQGLTALGDGRVVFSASKNTSGNELWVSDGTAAGTRLVADINPGVGDSDPGRFGLLGDGRLVFRANDGATGSELWATDGTAAGTIRVADLNPGVGDSDPGEFAALPDGRLLFSATDGISGQELWVTDGTEAGTTRVADIARAAGASGSPQDFTPLGDGRFVFRATDVAGTELWVTDGTAAGTERVADLNPIGSSIPQSFFPIAAPNQPPGVVGPIGNRRIDEGSAFAFAIPPSVFADPDPGDTLTLSATLFNRVALPAWLAFDAPNGTFSGTPSEADAGYLTIDVTATDGAGASATARFALTVRDRVLGTAADDTLLGDHTPELLAGRGGDDQLIAFASRDALRGNAGQDTLEGSAGARLIGGGGVDAFRYNNGPAIVVDFEAGVDRIEVSAAHASGFVTGVPLTAAQFIANPDGDAVGEAAQFIYRTTNGRLLWDLNGEAVGGRNIIMQLNGAPVLDATDLLVIA